MEGWTAATNYKKKKYKNILQLYKKNCFDSIYRYNVSFNCRLTVTSRCQVTRKANTWKHPGNLFIKNQQIDGCLLIRDLNPFMSESNAFYGQRNPKSRFVRKETVDIDILTTSWNADSKIMQSIKTTCRLHLRIRKWNMERGESV